MVKRFKDTDPDNPESLEMIIDTKINTRVKSAMYPIYWMVGGTLFTMLTIFLTVALPLQKKLMEVALVQELKAFTKDVDARFKESEALTRKQESLYIDKYQYYRIEEDEHRMLQEAFKIHDMTPYVMAQINANILKELGFDYTIRGGKGPNPLQ